MTPKHGNRGRNKGVTVAATTPPQEIGCGRVAAVVGQSWDEGWFGWGGAQSHAEGEAS